jgi:hypothetical protein
VSKAIFPSRRSVSVVFSFLIWTMKKTATPTTISETVIANIPDDNMAGPSI